MRNERLEQWLTVLEGKRLTIRSKTKAIIYDFEGSDQ